MHAGEGKNKMFFTGLILQKLAGQVDAHELVAIIVVVVIVDLIF